ncbi:MAG TPA: hypothetical protein VGH50_13605 [Candidatus Binatia bacterium]|jgi:type IV secretory pathway VirB10-like protein
MDCEDVKQLFRGFLESRLTLFQSALLLEHCDACSECRRELIGLQNQQKSATNGPRRMIFSRGTLRAPLGVAGILLAGCVALYIFQRAPAEIPAAKPVPSAPIDSAPAVKSVERAPGNPGKSVETRAPAKTPAKSSALPPQKAKPKVMPPQNDYVAGRREDRANRPARTETQKARSGDDVAKRSDVPESSRTAQDKEAAPDEKSADAGDLRFYSDIPPYFFLYKPSMKPL